MGRASWTLALTILGLTAVVLARPGAVDHHCDYTRPGVEPWWSDDTGETVERLASPGSHAEPRSSAH